ncbi:MAG: pyridoxal-phosphate dependent enzyme, partial [Candidatus Dormibacteraeota bacterium]|nr:pyridoxal-phosphate dependent enzyme [Candidatus Dormibacteraeota bacterium]
MLSKLSLVFHPFKHRSRVGLDSAQVPQLQRVGAQDALFIGNPGSWVEFHRVGAPSVWGLGRHAELAYHLRTVPDLTGIEEARRVIAGVALRTPLVRLDVPDAPGEIYLKLENLQPTGSFKIRGAANLLLQADPRRLAGGVWTASAGNAGQGLAWVARRCGIPCTVIVPESVPKTKVEGLERLGARILYAEYKQWWRVFEERSYPGLDGLFVHPFDEDLFMAGNGTIGLELLEDLPEVDCVVIPWGGGGLASGIASALRARKPSCTVLAAEVETSSPLAASLAAGRPAQVSRTPSFVDGIGGPSVQHNMFEMGRTLLDGSVVVSLDEVRNSIRLLAERARVIAEGAGAAPVAAALSGRAGSGAVACVV